MIHVRIGLGPGHQGFGLVIATDFGWFGMVHKFYVIETYIKLESCH